jgi:hypothetical protein
MGKIVKIQKGDMYGKLILTGITEFRNNVRYVEAQCECGNTYFCQYQAIKNGKTKSCGCKRIETYRNAATKHGLATRGNVHPIYNSYKGMKDRCYNPNDKRYHNYLEKNVIVCEEWLNDFESFYEWAMLNGWQRGLSIDRKENKGIYEPNNCRWTTFTIQNRNRDFNVNITAFNETKCLQEWFYDLRCSVSASTIRNRIKKGWEPELAISTPSQTIKGKSIKMTSWVPKNKRA